MENLIQNHMWFGKNGASDWAIMKNHGGIHEDMIGYSYGSSPVSSFVNASHRVFPEHGYVIAMLYDHEVGTVKMRHHVWLIRGIITFFLGEHPLGFQDHSPGYWVHVKNANLKNTKGKLQD